MTAAPLDRRRSQTFQQIVRNYGDADGLPIWQVARATSAAPKYFAPIKIRKGNGSEVVTFKDGGFGSNNPSPEACRDIIYKHGGLTKNIGPFVSIGTGTDVPLAMFDGKGGIMGNVRNTIANVKTVFKLPSRTLKAHEYMLSLSYSDNELKFPYHRFEGGKRLGKVDLGEWKGHKWTSITLRDKTPGAKTLLEIEAAVALYLKRPEVERELEEVARILVDRRRLRTRNASKWDRYASFSYYECAVKGCEKQHSNTLDDFKEHVRTTHHHKVDDQVLDNWIKKYRRVHWVYRPPALEVKASGKDKGKSKATAIPSSHPEGDY